jgi:hypothetical protein
MNKQIQYRIQKGRWRYVLTAPFRYAIRESAFDLLCYSGEHLVASLLGRGEAILQPGYAIDGATAPWPINRWLEDDKTMPGFFKHDLACQFQAIDAFRNHGITRIQADYMLYDDMLRAGRGSAPLVLLAVRLAAIKPPRRHPNLRVEVVDAEEEDFLYP